MLIVFHVMFLTFPPADPLGLVPVGDDSASPRGTVPLSHGPPLSVASSSSGSSSSALSNPFSGSVLSEILNRRPEEMMRKVACV